MPPETLAVNLLSAFVGKDQSGVFVLIPSVEENSNKDSAFTKTQLPYVSLKFLSLKGNLEATQLASPGGSYAFALPHQQTRGRVVAGVYRERLADAH